MMTKCVLSWYNCTGWLGIKHQFTYLLSRKKNQSAAEIYYQTKLNPNVVWKSLVQFFFQNIFGEREI